MEKIEVKETLIIIAKFHVDSTKGPGWWYRYKIDNKDKTAGVFKDTLLEEYKNKYNIVSEGNININN